MLKRVIIFLLISIYIVACGSSNIKQRIGALDESIKQYNISLRWGFYNKIEDYHMLRDGSRPKLDRSILENIRVTAYEVTGKIVSEDLNEATVSGEVNYYNNEYGTLKKSSFTHVWWYEPELKRWFNESEFVKFQ